MNTGHDTGGLLARIARRSKEKPPRLSTILNLLASSEEERIPIGRLVEAFADRAFGALMFIFALPNVIPMPPGTSAILGFPLVVIAAQLAVGRKTLWLPRAVMQRTIRTVDLQRINNVTGRYIRMVERLLSPRLTFFFGPVGDRVIGGICLLMAIILFLPIPLGNMVPALAIACFSLALLERDGLMALIGLVAAVVAIGILIALAKFVWLGIKIFLRAIAIEI